MADYIVHADIAPFPTLHLGGSSYQARFAEIVAYVYEHGYRLQPPLTPPFLGIWFERLGVCFVHNTLLVRWNDALECVVSWIAL